MESNKTPNLDSLTISAIAVVAYCSANVVHEAIGHGGACLMMGGKPESLNAIFLAYDEATVSSFGRVWIAAAGSVLNVIAGLVAATVLGRSRRLTPATRYFLWLFLAVNLLQASGYLLFSGVAGVGDWSVVLQPLGSPLISRLVLVALGSVLYFVVVARFLGRRLEPFLAPGSDAGGRLGRLVRLPYFVGGTTFILAGLLNPYGLKLVLISAAAASFGGTSLLVWYPFRVARGSTAATSAPLPVHRRLGWIVGAAVTLAFFIGVLGPGIGSVR
jgi:hypothetical protein